MKITSLDKNVTDLLKDFFFIPRFQRPYSWEKAEVEQFWNDTVVENTTDYFIGSVVFFKQGNRHGIVDGQQRIATIVMMLAALRNAFHAAGFTDASQGIQAIIEKTNIEFKKQFVLEPETTYPYFQDKILSSGPPQLKDDATSSEELLVRATFGYLKDWIADAVTSWPKPTGAPANMTREEAALRTIRDRLLALKLITVELENEDDAYIIFETLNTRGKDLQVSHLVKNLLSRLMKTENNGLDALKIKWESLLETFDATQAELDVDEYLHHFWLSRDKYVTAKKLFVAIKEATKSTAEAKSLLDDLVADAGVYRQIGEVTYGQWKANSVEIRASLQAIASTLRMRQPFPLLLSLMRCYRDGTLSRKNVESVLWAIESFHFTFTAVASKSSSGGLSLMYASQASKLFKAKSEAERQKIMNDVKKGLRARVPSKADFVAGFMELRNSDEFTKQRKLVKYILIQFDKHWAKPGKAVDYDLMTIEHVASQNPPAGEPKLSSDEIAMLGNQLLADVPLQNQLGNKSFGEKVKILKAGHLETAKSIVSKRKWDGPAVMSRTKEMAELAYDEIWKI